MCVVVVVCVWGVGGGDITVTVMLTLQPTYSDCLAFFPHLLKCRCLSEKTFCELFARALTSQTSYNLSCGDRFDKRDTEPNVICFSSSTPFP